jgi:hypothetical protein
MKISQGERLAPSTMGKPTMPSQPMTATSAWLREPVAMATTDAMPLSGNKPPSRFGLPIAAAAEI